MDGFCLHSSVVFFQKRGQSDSPTTESASKKQKKDDAVASTSSGTAKPKVSIEREIACQFIVVVVSSCLRVYNNNLARCNETSLFTTSCKLCLTSPAENECQGERRETPQRKRGQGSDADHVQRHRGRGCHRKRLWCLLDREAVRGTPAHRFECLGCAATTVGQLYKFSTRV